MEAIKGGEAASTAGRFNKSWDWGVGELEAIEAWEAEELKALEAQEALKTLKALEADAEVYENFIPGLFELENSADKNLADENSVDENS